MNGSDTIGWFEHDGGPLILLPREALPFWEGIEPPSGGRVVDATFRWDNQEAATDYDRACDVMDWAEILPVGPSSWGMVLPEDACGVALLALEGRTDTFAVVQSLLEETHTLQGYRAAFSEAAEDQDNWSPLYGDLEIRGGDILLLHAASSVDAIDEIAWYRTAQMHHASVLQAIAGIYSVDLYKLPESELDEAIFTRFQWVRPLP